MSKSKYFNKELQKRYALCAGAGMISVALSHYLSNNIFEDHPVIGYFVGLQLFAMTVVGLFGSYRSDNLESRME